MRLFIPAEKIIQTEEIIMKRILAIFMCVLMFTGSGIMAHAEQGSSSDQNNIIENFEKEVSDYELETSTINRGLSITISKVETKIPQNILGVSRQIPSTASNACYDYDSGLRPHSGWTGIDYSDSTGHAGTEADRVLRQMRILVTIKNGTTPVAGANVTLSTSLGSDAYIYKATSTTNSSGQLYAYIEFYGKKSFTVTASFGGTTKSQAVSSGTAIYGNKFFMTIYNFPLRSKFSTWSKFEEAVQINGTGYDDTTDQWYRYNTNGSIIAVSGPNNTSSGTTPTEYRTIAVDSPYITRRQYVSTGLTNSVYHRGRVIIEGLSSVSGDTGYRTAEDAGGAINGYHIDLFVGFMTVSEFYSAYSSSVPISGGYYFPQVSYYSTLVNTY